MTHSWSGNLVTCKNWECFWLNEGLTVFIEHKIVKILHGEELFLTVNELSDNDLKTELSNFGMEHEYTKLNPDLGFSNPDDAFSSIPYYKGMKFF